MPLPVSAKSWIKLIISVTLLVWVFKKMPLGNLEEALATCNWPWIVVSLIIVNLCMLVSAFKWKPLLNVQQIRISLTNLLLFYYEGLFANNFLPSSIGGDVLRVYNVAKASGKTREAAASVIMERLLAALALALTAAAALLLVAKQGGNSFIYWSVGGILAICLIILALFLFYPYTEEGLIGRWFCQLGKYREKPYALWQVLMLSFVFQGLLVAANYFIFQALGADIQPLKHFLYIPVIMAISMLPISINGIGVREGMYVVLYGYDGIEPATAVMGSLLFFMLVTVTSLAGGVILAVKK